MSEMRCTDFARDEVSYPLHTRQLGDLIHVLQT